MRGAKRILFRADSGLKIGTGHIMRCMTLADALRSAGTETLFLTRENSGHIIAAIRNRGHQVAILPGSSGRPYGKHPAKPVHASWLEADWQEDAEITHKLLKEFRADWLVMDHYALDSAWQRISLPEDVRLMVIDDLADRPHIADLLLDQNAGREARDYKELVPAGCDLKIGPSNALLRPEFAELRSEALARREGLDRPRSILVTLGGIDKENATGLVLDALACVPRASQMGISVVIGESAPHVDVVRAQAAGMAIPTEVSISAPNMAERMLRADLCIGAAGSTAWERCALGLPTLQIVLADNQRRAAESMASQNVSLPLPFPDTPGFATALSQALDQLSDIRTYHAISRRAAALSDGRGTERIIRALFERTSVDAH